MSTKRHPGRPVVCADCQRPSVNHGRGLCRRCWGRHWTAGTLDDFERPTRPRDELLTEWHTLERLGLTRREAAFRIGVTRGALDKAIERAARDTADRDQVAS